VQRASDPKLLARLARLELRARTAVEGLAGGRHSSFMRGSGTTFAEHREYVPGDEIRHIDWRLAARSDRHFVRRYEEETSLTGWLVVDLSASMQFTSLDWSKADYAKWLAASVARLLCMQGDSWGLGIANGGQIEHWLSAHGGDRHFQDCISLLENYQANGEGEPASSLAAAGARMDRRGLVIWISDCLGDEAQAINSAAQIRRAGHDMLTLRVLDPAEVNFPYGQSTRFDGLESADQLLLDPRAIREAYLAEFNKHGAHLRQGLRGLGCDFKRLETDQALDAGLVEFLARRTARLRRSKR